MSTDWYKITPAESARIDSDTHPIERWRMYSKEDTLKKHIVNTLLDGEAGREELYDKASCLNKKGFDGSHFGSQCEIVDESERRAVLKHLGKTSPYDYDVWLWPVHLGEVHWTSLAVYPNEKIVMYYDSFASSDPDNALDHCCLAIEWAEMVWKCYGRAGVFSYDDWKMIEIKNGPRQTNRYDCGVYMCQALYELAKGVPPSDLAAGWSFKDASMKDLRKIMREELATRTLRKR